MVDMSADSTDYCQMAGRFVMTQTQWSHYSSPVPKDPGVDWRGFADRMTEVAIERGFVRLNAEGEPEVHQHALAQRAGISDGVVSRLLRLERGCNTGTQRRIAAALGVSWNWLVTGELPREPSGQFPQTVSHPELEEVLRSFSLAPDVELQIRERAARLGRDRRPVAFWQGLVLSIVLSE